MLWSRGACDVDVEDTMISLSLRLCKGEPNICTFASRLERQKMNLRGRSHYRILQHGIDNKRRAEGYSTKHHTTHHKPQSHLTVTFESTHQSEEKRNVSPEI